ncbi:hypothetical protein [Paludisphaera rhizosphaerae]|nr:hypothetical protein [Paludisphaera rhizosphaerae]
MQDPGDIDDEADELLVIVSTGDWPDDVPWGDEDSEVVNGEGGVNVANPSA